jgi:hypothetical protein
VLLLHDATKLPKKQIGYMLNALETLEQTYLKPSSAQLTAAAARRTMGR